MSAVSLEDSIAGVVLAAGSSARMRGVNKLLVQVGGVAAIVKVCSAALETSLSPVVVVLGYEASQLRDVIESACTGSAGRLRFVVNERHREGRLSSVAAGLKSLEHCVGAALFLRGDQPWVSSRFLSALLKAYVESGASVGFPVFKGRKGSPVIVGKGHFHRFLALRGDRGTLELWNELWDSAMKLEVDDPRCLSGIDTPEDLQDMRLD